MFGFLAMLVSVAAWAGFTTANGSNRAFPLLNIQPPLIPRGRWQYQPNPQELAIFQRITPLYLGTKGSRPQPGGRSKLSRSRNGRGTQAVAARNVFAQLYHPGPPGPRRDIHP